METQTSKPAIRLALVTGASSGIGRAIALRLAHAGYDLALTGRDATRLAATQDRVAALGKGRSATFLVDLADADAVAALPAAVAQELGEPSVLVNNAGIAESAPLLKISLEAWRRTIDVDLTAVFLMIQAFLPAMLKRGSGRVIQIASTASKVGYPYVAAYCAAKHGVLGLTRALALEIAKSGVTVNAICPSYVATEMTERSVANIAAKTGKSADDARATLAAMNPQGRLVTPEEVAEAVVYLASDAARGINGQGLNLCGGAVAS
jgi:NAD(P)-dependent dehydrogenase (short-subunit alcohol dehydrogenase family)